MVHHIARIDADLNRLLFIDPERLAHIRIEPVHAQRFDSRQTEIPLFAGLRIHQQVLNDSAIRECNGSG